MGILIGDEFFCRTIFVDAGVARAGVNDVFQQFVSADDGQHKGRFLVVVLRCHRVQSIGLAERCLSIIRCFSGPTPLQTSQVRAGIQMPNLSKT